MRSGHGFTIIEVLVAIVLLELGVLALIHSYAGTTRMIGRGRLAALTAATAQTRLERLRQAVAQAPAPCSPVADGNAVYPTGINESWHVGIGARSAELTVIVSYPVTDHVVTDTFTTTAACP